MNNGTVKNLVPYIASAAIKAGVAVAIDEDGNEIKASKKKTEPKSNKEEKKVVDNKEGDKDQEIKALNLTHENALLRSMEAEEVMNAAKTASEADPENEELIKAHTDAADKWTELTGITEAAEKALAKETEGKDKGWLANLLGK